jgi:hypothetical protein
MLAWFAGLVFLLQMLAATQHDLAHTASDCAGCMLTAQPPSPPSLPVASQLVVAAAVLHYVLDWCTPAFRYWNSPDILLQYLLMHF